MTVVTKDNFADEVERSDKPCLIDLYADWCGPCKMLAPQLLRLESEYPNVKFCKINVDNEPELAQAFRVSSIPMLAVVCGGVFKDFTVGLVPEEKIRRLISDNV